MCMYLQWHVSQRLIHTLSKAVLEVYHCTPNLSNGLSSGDETSNTSVNRILIDSLTCKYSAHQNCQELPHDWENIYGGG